ncbi:hypothetical protein CY34DRAFT_797064 [Suillus luteus UH-Slu-Lm8-n1]|uniref:Uncharacterized protein n=1 Tax=Suillus luteus UH-Slu-Lm8-n1 TaxID=930992 RepID=A0A0D0B6D9_9AGAM|nr:hypothetical protein CY34DRAFT_797064 [Suillus luteus UH-Slu-Lm8-n1]
MTCPLTPYPSLIADQTDAVGGKGESGFRLDMPYCGTWEILIDPTSILNHEYKVI